jgi:hypothetical protein
MFRVKNEIEGTSKDEPLSVLIADIGAVPAPKPDKVSVTESEVQVPETEVSPKLLPDSVAEILADGQCTADSSGESGEMTFGGGDRTGLFLLIDRINESVGEGRGGGEGEGEARGDTAKGAAVVGHVSAATDSSSSVSNCSNNTSSNSDGTAETSGMKSTSSNDNTSYGDNGTRNRPKISLSDITPHNSKTESEKEREKEKAESAQIIANAKASTAAREQERVHSQGEAKARLAGRLRDRSHPPAPTAPSSRDAETAGKIGTVGVGSGQGEDGTNGVTAPLQPQIRVGLSDDVHSTVGTSTHSSSCTDTDGSTPSLCISQLLYDVNAADLKKDVSKRLFVTHAQYKFAYKIACDLCRKNSKTV